MLSKSDKRRLELLGGAVHLSVTLCHEIGLKARGRNARIAERRGITDRSVRRHTATARKAGLHCPTALPGRRPRTDYSTSRRGRRTSRGDRRGRAPVLDPLQRAAAAVARPGDTLSELTRVLRTICDQWPRAQYPTMSEWEAGKALRAYLDAGGQLGPEAERWWLHEVRRLPLDNAHTPWLAAASRIHLAPWLARRRQRERAELAEQTRATREASYVRELRAERPVSAEQIEAMRAAALGRVRRR